MTKYKGIFDIEDDNDMNSPGLKDELESKKGLSNEQK
jgi:hypothetical protein